MDVDHIILDGFQYGCLENPSGSERDGRAGLRAARPGRQRLGWLEGQSASPARDRFVSQPWLHLAQQLHVQGYRHDAILIDIARCRREAKFRGAPLLWRAGSRVLDWTAVFGFRPGRTLAWMVCLMVIFAGIWSWASSSCREAGCFDGRVYVMTQRAAFTGHDLRETYPAFHPLGYSADRFVPLLNLGYADRWRVNTNYGVIGAIKLPNVPVFLGGETNRERLYAEVTVTAGGLLYVLEVIEMLLGVIFTMLLVAGFARFLRRGVS
jgi:hypothetical protein